MKLCVGNRNYLSWSMRSGAILAPTALRTCIERVRALPGVAVCIGAAMAERDFLDFETPYRLRRE